MSKTYRILAFSPDPIVKVNVKVNGKQFGEATHSEGPLFVLPWDPHGYQQGVHTIEVTVEVRVNTTKLKN